jgi:L-aspartate oxidase
MLETGEPNMWLDARHLGRGGAGEDQAAASGFWERRFPTILASCARQGIDPTRDLIPVAPACHYASGGVHTDLWGRSSVPGLYATGEVACSGVHGANRLASNSLLEGLVFSRRIAEVLPGELRPLAAPAPDPRPAGAIDGAVRKELQEAMSARVGVLRSASGLTEALGLLDKYAGVTTAEVGPDAWEATNLVTVASALTLSALVREETRGSHWREDFPDRDDAAWSGHCDAILDIGAGQVEVAFTGAPATDLDLPEGEPA